MDDLRRRIAERVALAGTSFYAAMRLLPADRRHAMFAIYAFCREIDDIADSEAPAEEKKRQLAEWRREIERLYEGHPSQDITLALSPYLSRFRLRKEDFIALIDGMAMDAERDIWAPSAAELDLYCDRVASAVGRLSVRAFGAMEKEADDVAFHLGRALQLTNILRDLKEDLERNRLYLPSELLAKYRIEADKAVLDHPALRDVCREIALQAEGHFEKARFYMTKCRKASMRPAAIMGAVYHALLQQLRRMDWQDLSVPVSLPKWRKIWLAFRYGFL